MSELEKYRFDLVEVNGEVCGPATFCRLLACGPIDAVSGMLRDMPRGARGDMKLALVRERIVAGNVASLWEAYVYVKMTKKRVVVNVGLEWIRDGEKLVRV